MLRVFAAGRDKSETVLGLLATRKRKGWRCQSSNSLPTSLSAKKKKKKEGRKDIGRVNAPRASETFRGRTVSN